MNGQYTIALADNLSGTDIHVISQAIHFHFPYATIGDGSGALLITKEMISTSPCRIGHLIDIIEKKLFENRVFDIISYQNYALDWQTYTLTIGKNSLTLSERERDLMTELLLAEGNGCTKDYLLNKVWGYKAELDTHALETQIYRLRQKIENNPEDPQLLITIPNGYKLA